MVEPNEREADQENRHAVKTKKQEITKHSVTKMYNLKKKGGELRQERRLITGNKHRGDSDQDNRKGGNTT